MTDRQTYTMSVTALARSISSTGKSGHTDYIFVSTPRNPGSLTPEYFPWCRPQDLPTAIVTAQVGFSHYSQDRHSATVVEVEVPVGTLRKTVHKDVRRGSTTTVDRLTAAGEWAPVKHVGAKKDAAGAWITVVEIDGRRVEVR